MPQENQYPWNVLEIEETIDKKLIKKAYAVLIKQYKPDEHPEKFQEIQEAYKYAIETIKWKAQDDSNYINSDKNVMSDYSLENYLSNQADTANKSESEIIHKILTKTELLIQAELIERESIHNWKFLEASNQILELKARELFSQKLFALVSEYNNNFHNRNKRPRLLTHVMQYINNFVDWNSKWQDYSFIFDSQELQLMYIALEEDEKKQQIAPIDLGLRILALFSDLSVSYFFAAYFYYFKDYTLTETLILTFKIFVISRVIIELIFKQSIGKSNRNIFIADKFGNRCTFIKTIIRHLVINLTLLPIYVWIFNLPINSTIWISVFCTMIFLHIVSISNGDKLFHDVLTKTIVFRKE